ncbi:MAG: transcription-repair coupling factor [Candidatus Goldbacteria bacterium]|nr:transcription-repair coupling factor [Candidatus Goldiibacteriota bacterium]
MKQCLLNSSKIKKVLDELKKNNKNIKISGVTHSFAPVFYSFLGEQIEKSIFIITTSEKTYFLTESISNFINIYGGKIKTVYYPEDDSLIYKNIKSSPEICRIRGEAYLQCILTENKIFVTDIGAITEKIPTPKEIKEHLITLKKGEKINFDKILHILNENDYERKIKVENYFEYAVRGAILDIFSPGYTYPVRIELFGDKIDSLHFFSAETSLTTKEINEIDIFLFNPGKKNNNANGCIVDMFDIKKCIVIIDNETEIKKEILEKITKIKKYLDINNIEEKIFSIKSIFKKLNKYQKIRTYEIHNRSQIKFDIKVNPPFNKDMDLLFSYAEDKVQKGYKFFVISDNRGEEKHLKDFLMQKEKDENKKITPFINFIIANLDRGFVFESAELIAVSNREIFERYFENYEIVKRKKLFKPVRHITELKENDYVVHKEHGIGIFMGIKTLEVENTKQDFIVILYAGSDKLYLPVYKIDFIDRYIGGEKPNLSKLGSKIFRKTKEEIKKELEQIAKELLTIYARREMQKGISFPADDETQKIFEEAFIYDETPDQIKAIEDVKRDMQSNKKMDRLICGDAGFGKTEVAIRAAFKAVNAGYQVIILTSTTLLALQHYKTFSERMADYPINIAMLSRLVSEAKKKKIYNDLENGKIDILIGTSAVLNKNLKFSNVGLVVIDEEQHFGVKAKEYIRKNYPSADFLTLTATPIPRTLYLSLSGIRDISVINTPPPGKRPIEVYIMNERISVVKELILREILRKGQVFYIYNNINTINRIYEILSTAMPEIKFKIAHGKMKKHELEKIMFSFINREFDVLITTTIIESGLDLPDVNTIIISNAERFGLSQLYQLKGRVGRRDKQAYAYLLVKDFTSLTDTAKERLKAIESYVDAGSGFMIAMKDLELRGAGSVLSTKQHGNMEKIGFELYCKLLEETVMKLKGQEMEEEVETKINVDFKAYIPESYIWDSSEKLRIYRQIFKSKTKQDIEEIEREVTNVWGNPPEEFKNILFVGVLKIFGRQLKISEITIRDNNLNLLWGEKNMKYIMELKEILKRSKYKITSGYNSILISFNKKEEIKLFFMAN